MLKVLFVKKNPRPEMLLHTPPIPPPAQICDGQLNYFLWHSLWWWRIDTLAGSIDFWISPHGIIATVCAWYDCLWVGKMYLHIHTLDDLHVDLNLKSKNLLSIQIQSWNPDFHFLFYIFKLPSSNSSFILNSDLFTKFEKLPEFVLHPVAWTVVCRKHLVISF